MGRMHVRLAAIAALAAISPARSAWAGDSPAILQPADGATVSSPVTVVVSQGTTSAPMDHMSGMGDDMAANGGMSMVPGAHLHLIIDASLPKTGSLVPMDARHIHLMHGETKVTLRLPPGQHTLQLLLGSAGHRVPSNPEISSKVTITVR